ncbi:TAF4-domain-containing protein [Nadsonia fulvescens var. elongata DSM 6958]|uniref:Transcription initiation factor TFIID subunit 4 n=1 Tax=Nadsonia fulvescens var. elongata DSM 6958 TaxID=857566 RepID=A0A1E3PSW2_9ASCO|nr:TAF4-domain-containing protein [Nadsonia fulvescens var. elongata DSM 6958]
MPANQSQQNQNMPNSNIPSRSMPSHLSNAHLNNNNQYGGPLNNTVTQNGPSSSLMMSSSIPSSSLMANTPSVANTSLNSSITSNSQGTIPHKRPTPPLVGSNNTSSVKRTKIGTTSSLNSVNQNISTPTSTMPPPSNIATSTNQSGASQLNSSTGTSNSGPSALDPDQLSDALLSAGVDLKEEENLLYSSTIAENNDMKNSGTQGVAGTNTRQNITAVTAIPTTIPFLDSRRLKLDLRKSFAECGLKNMPEKEGNEVTALISLACEEWISGLLTGAIMNARHRRKSRNDIQSDISKALRIMAIKDKESEEKRLARKSALGLDVASSLDDSKKGADNEETQHRAANATAAMMTMGKKKYSWMSSGGNSPAGGMRTPSGMGSTRGSNDGIRHREAREEQGLVLRDLLGVLENERIGVERAIVKGYAKLRN